MGNCLKTQLKEQVQNEYLGKLEEIVVKNALSKNSCRIISSDSNGTIYAVSGNPFVVNETSQSSVPLDGTTFDYVAADNAIIKIENKYKINFINFNSLNTADLKYCPLEYLKVNNLTGNIAELPKSITRLYLTNGDAVGDIAEVPFNEIIEININDCNFICSNIANITNKIDDLSSAVVAFSYVDFRGTLEGIVEAFKEKGHTNGTLLLRLYNTNITFGGIKDINNEYLSNEFLKWDSSSIIYQLGTDADIADSSKDIKIFVKGVTASQISTWESQGNTVYVVD